MVDWDEVQKTHGQAVWSVAYRILGHDEDARDCYQDVFFEALRLPDAAAIGNWGGYLRWLATRRAIDLLRTRRRRRTLNIADQELSATESLHGSAESSETIELVRHELTKLPDSQATAFWLFSVEGLSYQEIADQTGSNVNAVGLQIHRARQQLKQRLSQLLDQTPSQRPRISHE